MDDINFNTNLDFDQTEPNDLPLDQTYLEKKVADLEKNLEEEKYQKLKALADCDNLRKRFEEEIAKARSLGNTLIFSKLLELSDDIERIREKSANEEDVQKVLQNFDILGEKIFQFLHNQGIEELHISEGDKFDEEKMEAISLVDVDEESKDDTVRFVVQKGYMMKSTNTTLRPTKVIVGKFNYSN